MLYTAFIGCGNLGAALVNCGVQSGIEISSFRLSEPRLECRYVITKRYGFSFQSTSNVVRNADLVFLCVNQKDIPTVVTEIRSHLKPASLVVSCVAALPLQALRDKLPGKNVIRAMPSLLNSIHQGSVVFYGHTRPSFPPYQHLMKFFGNTPKLIVDSEDKLETATVVSASMPAYWAKILDAMITRGEKLGLTPEASSFLLRNSFRGSGNLLFAQDLKEFQRRGDSPGGVTERGLRAFDEFGLEYLVGEVLESSRERLSEIMPVH